MQDGRVRSRAHDGRIAGPLASVFHPHRGHSAGNGAFRHSRLHPPLHHHALRQDRRLGCLLDQLNLAFVFDLAQRHREGSHVVPVRRVPAAQSRCGKAQQRRRRGGIRLRPQIDEERAVGGDHPAQLCRQLGHRFHMVHAGRIFHTGSGGIHLHAGVCFHAQVARGQEENFLVGLSRGGLRRIAFDQ